MTTSTRLTAERPQSKGRHVKKTMASPVGTLTLIATNNGLAAILWENDRLDRVRLDVRAEDPRHPILVETEQQLREYFAGERREFSVPLDVTGTPFQREVWTALLAIPYGETRSYRTIAEQIGRPAAVRAVGAANGRNPVSIITPCHRVIGSSGALTGFAGGLGVKAYLLALEQRRPAATSTPDRRRSRSRPAGSPWDQRHACPLSAGPSRRTAPA